VLAVAEHRSERAKEREEALKEQGRWLHGEAGAAPGGAA